MFKRGDMVIIKDYKLGLEIPIAVGIVIDTADNDKAKVGYTLHDVDYIETYDKSQLQLATMTKAYEKEMRDIFLV